MTLEIEVNPTKSKTLPSMQLKSTNVKQEVFYRLAEEGALPALKYILNKNSSDYFNPTTLLTVL